MLFTFRRDTDGRETVHVGDVAIARITDHPEGFEWLNSMPGITSEHLREAAVKADEVGFWICMVIGADDYGTIYRSSNRFEDDEVTVDVPVAETTSTVLSITNAEDQS